MPAGPRPLSPAGEGTRHTRPPMSLWVPELSRTATWLSLPKPSRPIRGPRCDRPYYRQVAVLGVLALAGQAPPAGFCQHSHHN